MTNQGASCFPRVELESIDHMRPQELDTLPFGAIQLDAKGTILRFWVFVREIVKAS